MEQALQRFEYLKNSWDGVLPTGLVAVKFVDHSFDKIERFNPYNSLTDQIKFLAHPCANFILKWLAEFVVFSLIALL